MDKWAIAKFVDGYVCILLLHESVKPTFYFRYMGQVLEVTSQKKTFGIFTNI